MNNKNHYSDCRYPPEVISHLVWLYLRFTLSFQNIEEILALRGIEVSYESIRARAGRLGDTWYLDEVFLSIKGERYFLWRAVDQDGETLDILVQPPWIS